jgi:hypothetical protein
MRQTILEWLWEYQHIVGPLANTIACVDDEGTLVVDDYEEVDDLIRRINEVRT